MWMNLFNAAHNSLGMHFWDLPALLAGVIILVELVVHTRNQKKREDELDEERTERLETMQKGVTGRP